RGGTARGAGAERAAGGRAGGRAGAGAGLTAAELRVEPLLGWRLWQVERRGGELRLGSWTRSRVWPTGERLEARCGPACLGREAPAHGHRCGIYALRTC